MTVSAVISALVVIFSDSMAMHTLGASFGATYKRPVLDLNTESFSADLAMKSENDWVLNGLNSDIIISADDTAWLNKLYKWFNINPKEKILGLALPKYNKHNLSTRQTPFRLWIDLSPYRWKALQRLQIDSSTPRPKGFVSNEQGGYPVAPNLVEGVVGGYPTLKHILNIFENFIKNFCGKILSNSQTNIQLFWKNILQKISIKIYYSDVLKIIY